VFRCGVETFVFRCPRTGLNVQGFVADDISSEEEVFVSVACLACRQAHFVNPKTGKRLGDDSSS
jgi:hypothetical protein